MLLKSWQIEYSYTPAEGGGPVFLGPVGNSTLLFPGLFDFYFLEHGHRLAVALAGLQPRRQATQKS